MKAVTEYLATTRALFTQQNVAYAATSFGFALLNSIFGLYQVDLFTSVYKLDASYFYSVQMVYAVWNAVNDPLFGWIIDNTASGSGKRLPAIKYGGPLWALAFLLPWFPWADASTSGGMGIIAVQFCLCLCAYDTFFTYVLCVHCAIIADMTTSNFERNQMNLLRTYGYIGGSAIASISYLFWDKENLFMFRGFCILIAIVASAAFWYTGTHLKLERMDRMRDIHEKKDKHEQHAAKVGMWQFFLQLLNHKNFWMYVAMNFWQNFHNTFAGNYWLFFVDKIVEPIFPTAARRVFIFLSMYLPHIMVPLMTPFANAYSKYAVINVCTKMKLALGMMMLFVDVRTWQIWAPLFLLNRLLMSCSGFFDVVIADVIDEDMVLNKRPESLATSVHGIQSLFVKPAQSLAPMFGVYALSQYAINHSTKELEAANSLGAIQTNSYHTFVLVTIGCGVVQLMIWRHFTLYGARLKQVKVQLNQMESVPEKQQMA